MSDQGQVLAAGRNYHGQLGLGHTNDVAMPHEIDAGHFGNARVAAVACGGTHTLMLTCEGGVFACGHGHYGATGLGHANDATAPAPVVGEVADARAVRIAAGAIRSWALAEDGRVFGFGVESCVPQLLLGALAGTTVRALGVGCFAQHSIFLAGAPPAEPGFDAPVTRALQKPAALQPRTAAEAGR